MVTLQYIVRGVCGLLGRTKPKSGYDSMERSATFVLVTAEIETSHSGQDDENVTPSKSEFNADSSDVITVF